MTRFTGLALICLLASPLQALAADDSHDMKQHAGHDMNHDMAQTSEADKAFAEANKKMHEAMAIKPSGNPDVDFAQSMIPHHEGAIDMAKIVLKYGKDPEIRKLAENVIKAQESEVAFMKAWLEKHE